MTIRFHRLSLSIAAALWLAIVALVTLVSACGGGSLAAHTDGLDARTLPVAIQPDYVLFQDRCSKCHSLARALNSGIDSNEYWDRYVERMRRQPGSGISIEDTHVILRFLYYYAAVQRQAKSSANDSIFGKVFGALEGRGATDSATTSGLADATSTAKAAPQ